MIYEPAEDSFLLSSQIKKYVKNKSFLDMGSGSGILAQIALEEGASRILAVDINKEAVLYIKSKKINAIKSDLFNNINEKFDIIAFNPPYLPLDYREPNESRIATTGGKKGDEIIIRFLKQSKAHLNKEGFILLLLSSLTPRNRIMVILKKLKLKHKKIAEKSLFFEKLEVWEIKRDKHNNQ